MRPVPTTLRNLATTVAILACAAMATAQQATPNPLAKSRVFPNEDMTPKTAPNGAVGRNLFTGRLVTGEAIGVHETMQPKGTVPNPAHRIEHSELILVEEGTLEYMHDGVTERANAGSVVYVAFGTLHSVRNVGDGEAKYVVIQIGGDTGK